MDIGVMLFPTDLATQPVPLAGAVEERGPAGVGEVIVGLPPAGRDVVLPLLDRCASLVGAV